MATVLVIDDREANRKVLSTLLRHTGHQVLEAHNGQDGLSKAHTAHPDLIITDLLMPVMDGFEFVRLLRADAMHAHVPVIYCTANYLEPNARALADACGPNHFLTKPIEPSTLLEVVASALDPHSHPQPAALAPLGESEIQKMHLAVLQDKLFEKVGQLESLNANLEERIRNRTLELEVANEKLAQQVEERERINRELEQTRKEQVELKDQFLSNVSHELRSPLMVIHEFVSILIDGLGGPINADQQEYLQIARRNTNQLKRMIDDLLETSRAAEGKLFIKRSVTSPMEIVTQTIRSFGMTAARKAISVEADIPESLPDLYVDPARVIQVLTNLLDNAVKFSQPASAIAVQVRILEEDPGFVCISVADNGCGIAAEESERVFDRLHQANNTIQSSRRGLGLGLYICKELIELHGGRIWNDRARRGGCTMKFTVPIFALGSLIEPIVKKCTATDSTFALLTVEVSPGESWSSEQQRARTRLRISDTIEQCILPDLDVFLPPQSRGQKSFFWVVARTNKKGADVIEKRIRGQLAELQDLKKNGIFCDVFSEVLEIDMFTCDSTLEQRVEGVTARLEKMLKTE